METVELYGLRIPPEVSFMGGKFFSTFRLPIPTDTRLFVLVLLHYTCFVCAWTYVNITWNRHNTMPNTMKFGAIIRIHCLSRYRRVHGIASIRFMSVCISVRPSTWKKPATTKRISWNFVFEYVSKIWPPKFEVHYSLMIITGPFLSYLARLFLEWEMFHTGVVEKIKIHILSSIIVMKVQTGIRWTALLFL